MDHKGQTQTSCMMRGASGEGWKTWEFGEGRVEGEEERGEKMHGEERYVCVCLCVEEEEGRKEGEG